MSVAFGACPSIKNRYVCDSPKFCNQECKSVSSCILQTKHLLNSYRCFQSRSVSLPAEVVKHKGKAFCPGGHKPLPGQKTKPDPRKSNPTRSEEKPLSETGLYEAVEQKLFCLVVFLAKPKTQTNVFKSSAFRPAAVTAEGAVFGSEKNVSGSLEIYMKRNAVYLPRDDFLCN